jgi:hypothetical protein
MVKEKSRKVDGLVDEKWKHAPKRSLKGAKTENDPKSLTTSNFHQTRHFQFNKSTSNKTVVKVKRA